MACRVLVDVHKKLLAEISVPNFYRSISSYTRFSTTSARTDMASRVLVDVHKKLLAGISIPNFYRSISSYRGFFTTSACGNQHQSLVSRTQVDPFDPSWHDTVSWFRPDLHTEIFDKIRDESLQAICCYHSMSDWGYRHAFVIIEKLLEQYPHIHTFHFLLSPEIYEEEFEDEKKQANLSSVPMFRFYQNGKKVLELDGKYITRFKKVLAKLYKPHDGGSNQNYFGDSTFEKEQGTGPLFRRLFSTVLNALVSNRQPLAYSAYGKIHGCANFELIMSEEYILGDGYFLAVDTPAVVCFAKFCNYASCYLYSLLCFKFSKRYPHVAIYYVVLDPEEEDDYKRKLEKLPISHDPYILSVQFFRDGRWVAFVTSAVDNVHEYERMLEKYFEEFYNTEQSSKDEQGFQRLRKKMVKELDCSTASLGDIIKDAGKVFSFH